MNNEKEIEKLKEEVRINTRWRLIQQWLIILSILFGLILIVITYQMGWWRS